jgi:hypothetical protein
MRSGTASGPDIANPITAIEQMSSLIFFIRVDNIEIGCAALANRRVIERFALEFKDYQHVE